MPPLLCVVKWKALDNLTQNSPALIFLWGPASLSGFTYAIKPKQLQLTQILCFHIPPKPLQNKDVQQTPYFLKFYQVEM